MRVTPTSVAGSKAGSEARKGPSAMAHSARSPESKRTERKLQILEGARLLFSQEGYAGFSVRTLARRMGMSQGHLQYYFARKEELFEALVRSIIESYEPQRIVADFGQRTPEKQLEGFVRFLIEDLKDPVTNAIFFELWSIGQRDRFAMMMVDQFYSRYVTNFDRMFAAINPKVDSRRRRTRAALAATQIEGLMILLAKGRPRHDYLAGIEDECVARILGAARQP
jgi:AcrR family transcriptional regulator